MGLIFRANGTRPLPWFGKVTQCGIVENLAWINFPSKWHLAHYLGLEKFQPACLRQSSLHTGDPPWRFEMYNISGESKDFDLHVYLASRLEKLAAMHCPTTPKKSLLPWVWDRFVNYMLMDRSRNIDRLLSSTEVPIPVVSAFVHLTYPYLPQ